MMDDDRWMQWVLALMALTAFCLLQGWLKGPWSPLGEAGRQAILRVLGG